MRRILEQIISILFIDIPTLGLYRYIKVGTHHYMVKEHSDAKYLYKASFSDFKKEFNKREWILMPFYYSLKTPKSEAYLHADILRFEQVGFLMTPYGFLIANFLIRKKYLELENAIKNNKRISKEEYSKLNN